MVAACSFALISSTRVLTLCCRKYSPVFLPAASKSISIYGELACCCSTPKLTTTAIPSTVARIPSSMKRTKDLKGKGKTRKLPGNEKAAKNGGKECAIDTPAWFKLERMRCLTEATAPRDGGNSVAGNVRFALTRFSSTHDSEARLTQVPRPEVNRLR